MAEIPGEPGKGRVYFLVEDGGERVKIGKTTNLAIRLRDLGRLSPRPLHLACLIEGYTAVERYFHTQFSRQRVLQADGTWHGEWFHLDEDLSACINEILDGGTSAVLCPTHAAHDGVQVVPANDPPPEYEPTEEDRIIETKAKIAQIEELRIKILRRKGRESLAEFFKQSWHIINPGVQLEWGKHIEALCFHVQCQLEDRARAQDDPTYKIRAQNMVINCPPRSLKSAVLAVGTVWAWLRWPSMKILFLSANPRVSQNSARMARDLITNEWFRETYQPTWTIRRDQDALSDMGNTAGGMRLARGLDSTVTGEGSAWLIIDDPHDLRDTVSQIAATMEGYKSAVHNRVNDPRTSIRTCIMQRVGPNDFTGEMLPNGWFHVRIPMEFELEPHCPCETCVGVNVFGWSDWRTTEGEVVHPRFTSEFLEAERLRLGSFGYAAQMQQRPVPAGGNRVRADYWRFFRLEGHYAGDRNRPPGCVSKEEHPTFVVGKRHGRWELDWVVISVDPAAKKTERGSNWGLLAIGGKDNRRFILDDRTRRGDINEILDVIRSMIVMWRPDKLIIEAKVLGPALEDTIREEIATGKIRDLDGKPLITVIDAIDPQGEKEQRLDAVLTTLAANLVYLLEGAPWLEELVAEHSAFPNGARNDRVDAMTQALNHVKPNDYAALVGAGGLRLF